MFEAKRGLKTILAEIPPSSNGDRLTIVGSSWRSTRKEYPLPAIVVDLESVRPAIRTEDNHVAGRAHRLPCTMHVKVADRTDEAAEDDLEQWIDTIEAKIREHHGDDYEIEDYTPMEVPFGKQQALAGAFMLVLND